MMKNIIIGLIMCVVDNNYVFGNIVLIEQDITYVFKSSEDANTEQNSLNDTNGNTHVLSEPYTDLNNNGKYDYAEKYFDDNHNGIWDNDESFQDLNQNGICDAKEPFIDKGNGVYDVGEEFVDVNGNNMYDLELWYVDNNRNGKWDAGDPFEDLNNDGIYGYNEPFIDQNNNNRYDAPEKIGDSKFTFSAISFSELFIDVPNGRYDVDEEYEDLNGDGQWTPAEEYEDLNGDGQWTPAEEYEDLNGDGQWTPAEEYEDLNDDGKWTIGNEQHDPVKKSILHQEDEGLLIYDTLITSVQNDIIANTSPYTRSFKSPGKAILYSGVLPGMGQVYMGNWMRALLFVSIDVAAIGTWYHNNSLAEDKKRKYSYYANDHWDFGRWVHDYYKWYEYKEGDDNWNSTREVFINYSDSTYGCAQDPTQGHCFTDFWDHAHKVEFTYNGKIVSTSSEEDFKTIFKNLCGNQYIFDKECSKDVIDLKDSNGDTIFVIRDHHFYEGIGKYNLFYSGWDDNDSVSIDIKKGGYKTASSPNKVTYHNYWNNYNQIKRLAVKGGNFMLINRVVSMVDALLLAKKWNNKNNIKLSLNAYPNLRNKSGVGGVKLSLHFK